MNPVVRPRQYLLGHSGHELIRLERQAQLFARESREFLQLSGIEPGMRILDVGCGAGDLSLIAAEIVGPEGRVLGVDRSGEALAFACRRAEAAGAGWVRFEQAELAELVPAGAFDAVIGRFVLLHLSDPETAIRDLVPFVRPNGVIGFMEMDISSAAAVPRLALFDQCLEWIVEVYREAGIEIDMGSKLYATFRQAGLSPQLTGSCRVDAGEESAAYELIAETVRSLVPHIEALGLASADDLNIDALSDRLRREANGERCFIFPRLVGAWANTLNGS